MFNMLSVNLFGIIISFEIFKSRKAIIGGVLEKGVLKNFINVIKKETPRQVFFHEFCEIFENNKSEFSSFC